MDHNVHRGHRRRMKEQFLENGLDRFNAHQVLELLLFYAIPQRDTNPIAHELLSRFGSLSKVLDASPEELMAVDGISFHTATLLKLSRELVGRYHQDATSGYVYLDDPAKLVEYLRAKFLNQKHESVYLLCMDNRFKVLACEMINSGTLTTVQLDLGKIINIASHSRATIAVLAHNHPAGSAKASEEDISTTLSVSETLDLINVELLDHFIFAPVDYISMRKDPRYSPLFAEYSVQTRRRKRRDENGHLQE